MDEASNQENEQLRLAKTLLTINEAYKETIDEKIASLRKKLELNQQQQADLVREISANSHEKAVSKSSKGLPSKDTNNAKQNETELSKIKSNYFKDLFNSEPEPSIDAYKKSRLDFYDHIPQLKPEWSVKYRRILKEAVIKDAIRLLKLPFTQRIAFLEDKVHRLNISMEATKKTLKEIKLILKETHIKCKEIDEYTELEILGKIDVEQIDWMKIAKMDLDSRYSPTECRLVWLNVCSSAISQEKWTHTELKQLIDLARKYKEKNWDIICRELNTNRSAFLCLKRYHEKTVEKFCKRDWTEKESQELCSLAEQLRTGQYIPYNYLCYLNGTRDRNSIYNWHIKVDPNLNHGKWTPQEEQAFEEALLFYNTVYNWQEISEHVVTRTSHQCKDRYELKYHNPEKYINWTIEDDKKLLESYRKYEGQWYKIAAFEFPNRNDNACLFRHTRLMTWHRQNAWFENQEPEIKEFILFICKNKRNREEVPVYTNDGEIIPRKPIFAQSVTNLEDQLLEKKDLIKEFISKKRIGHFNFNLINRIDIHTPTLNSIINKFKKRFQQASSSAGSKIKQPRNHRLSAEKLEQNRLRREALKQEKAAAIAIAKTAKKNRIKPGKAKTKQKHIKHLIHVSPVKKKDALASFNYLVSKKQENKIAKKNEIKRMKALKKKAPLKINHYFQNIDSTNQSEPNEASNTNFENNNTTDTNGAVNAQTVPKPYSRKHIRSLINNSLQTDESASNQSESQQSMQSPQVLQKVPKKRGRKKKTPSPEGESKRMRKEKVHVDVIQPVNVVMESQHLKAMKETKLNQFERSLKSAELSPLVVPFNEIPDGEKIPCVAEQSSLFKFMYLLKKTESNSKYFYKYTIIKCSGDRYVAIKPFSGQLTAEYLNEKRLEAVGKILDQVFKKSK